MANEDILKQLLAPTEMNTFGTGDSLSDLIENLANEIKSLNDSFSKSKLDKIDSLVNTIASSNKVVSSSLDNIILAVNDLKSDPKKIDKLIENFNNFKSSKNVNYSSQLEKLIINSKNQDNKLKDVVDFITGGAFNKELVNEWLDEAEKRKVLVDKTIENKSEAPKKINQNTIKDETPFFDEMKFASIIGQSIKDAFNSSMIGSPNLVNVFNENASPTYANSFIKSPQIKGFAEGKLVQDGKDAPSKKDSILAMLSPNEFVVNPEAVKRGNNLGLLNAINDGRFTIPGFADGGTVSSSGGGGGGGLDTSGFGGFYNDSNIWLKHIHDRLVELNFKTDVLPAGLAEAFEKSQGSLNLKTIRESRQSMEIPNVKPQSIPKEPKHKFSEPIPTVQTEFGKIEGANSPGNGSVKTYAPSTDSALEEIQKALNLGVLIPFKMGMNSLTKFEVKYSQHWEDMLKSLKDSSSFIFNKFHITIDEISDLNAAMSKAQGQEKIKLRQLIHDFDEAMTSARVGTKNIVDEWGNIQKAVLSDMEREQALEEARNLKEDLGKYSQSINKRFESDLRALAVKTYIKNFNDAIVSAIQSASGLIQKTTGFADIGESINPYNIIKNKIEIDSQIGRALSTTEGLNKDAIQNSIQRAEVPDLMNQTGDVNDPMGINQRKQFNKLLRSGLRDQKVAKDLSVQSAFASSDIEANTDSTNELFKNMSMNLGMTRDQTFRMSMDLGDVASATGVMGDDLLDAVKSSEQLMKNMKNVGSYSSDAGRNIIGIMAESKKLGVEEGANTILSALTDGPKMFREGGKMLNASMQALGNISDQNMRRKVDSKLRDSTLLGDSEALGAYFEGLEKVIFSSTKMNLKDIQKLTGVERQSKENVVELITGMGSKEFMLTMKAMNEGSKTIDDRIKELQSRKIGLDQAKDKPIIESLDRKIGDLQSTERMRTIGRVSESLNTMQMDNPQVSMTQVLSDAQLDRTNVVGSLREEIKRINATRQDDNKIFGGKNIEQEIGNALSNPERWRSLQEIMEKAVREEKIKRKREDDELFDAQMTLAKNIQDLNKSIEPISKLMQGWLPTLSSVFFGFSVLSGVLLSIGNFFGGYAAFKGNWANLITDALGIFGTEGKIGKIISLMSWAFSPLVKVGQWMFKFLKLGGVIGLAIVAVSTFVNAWDDLVKAWKGSTGILNFAITAVGILAKQFITDAWGLIKGVFVDLPTWIYNSIISPIGSGVSSIGSGIYDNILAPIGNGILFGLRTIFLDIPKTLFYDIPKFMLSGLYEYVIKPIASGVKEYIINPLLGLGDSIVKAVNDYIINPITSWAKTLTSWIPSMPEIPGFAEGGLVGAGFNNAKGVDTIPAMLSPNEFVVNPKAVKQGDNLEVLNAMNRGNIAFNDRKSVDYLLKGNDTKSSPSVVIKERLAPNNDIKDVVKLQQTQQFRQNKILIEILKTLQSSEESKDKSIKLFFDRNNPEAISPPTPKPEAISPPKPKPEIKTPPSKQPMGDNFKFSKLAKEAMASSKDYKEYEYLKEIRNDIKHTDYIRHLEWNKKESEHAQDMGIKLDKNYTGLTPNSKYTPTDVNKGFQKTAVDDFYKTMMKVPTKQIGVALERDDLQKKESFTYTKNPELPAQVVYKDLVNYKNMLSDAEVQDKNKLVELKTFIKESKIPEDMRSMILENKKFFVGKEGQTNTINFYGQDKKFNITNKDQVHKFTEIANRQDEILKTNPNDKQVQSIADTRLRLDSNSVKEQMLAKSGWNQEFKNEITNNKNYKLDESKREISFFNKDNSFKKKYVAQDFSKVKDFVDASYYTQNIKPTKPEDKEIALQKEAFEKLNLPSSIKSRITSNEKFFLGKTKTMESGEMGKLGIAPSMKPVNKDSLTFYNDPSKSYLLNKEQRDTLMPIANRSEDILNAKPMPEFNHLNEEKMLAYKETLPSNIDDALANVNEIKANTVNYAGDVREKVKTKQATDEPKSATNTTLKKVEGVIEEGNQIDREIRDGINSLIALMKNIAQQGSSSAGETGNGREPLPQTTRATPPAKFPYFQTGSMGLNAKSGGGITQRMQ